MRPNQVSQVSQVSRHRNIYIHTPHAERNNDFLKTIREINNLIVALHHSQNVSTHTYPASIARKEQDLMGFIKPAKPTNRTLELLQGAAKNWAYTTLLILVEHFNTLIETTKKDLSECLTQDYEKAFSIATKWAKKNLGKRLKEKTLDTARTTVIDLYNTQTHTSSTPTHPTPHSPCPFPSPPSPPSTGTRNPDERTGTTGTTSRGPGELSQEDFPELTANRTPEEPWTPAGRKRNNRKPQRDQTTEGPKPQRDQTTRRQTTPPRDANQKTTQERRNSEGNQTPPERPTEDTTTQGEAQEQEGINETQDRKPNYWTGGTRAQKNTWRLTPNRDIIIIGDSNLNKIPKITDGRIQIESYSGMNLEWAETVLRRTEKNETATHLILSVGINNRNQKKMQTSITAVRKLRATAKRQFPNADRRIALINYSEELGKHQKRILINLNEEIKKEPNLPKLPATNFQTGTDKIHWEEDTAVAMLQHWISSLN